MSKEKALEAWQKLLSEIDKETWLFVGTINPQMVVIAIKAIEKELEETEWQNLF